MTWSSQHLKKNCDLTYTREITPSQTLNLKHVEIIKFSGNQTCDISLESL